MKKVYLVFLKLAVYLFDVKTGNPFGQGQIKHSTDILEIGLSQAKSSFGRNLTVIDKNRELFMTKIVKEDFKKLGKCHKF
jgi:intraflagellar transport protein 80